LSIKRFKAYKQELKALTQLALKLKRSYKRRLIIKTRDEPYNIYKKRGKPNSNSSKARNSIVLIVTILLETISGSDQVDCYINYISSF
jgi:hypothetical protein